MCSGCINPPPSGDLHGGWDADSVTFSTVPGPGIRQTVCFPWFRSPRSQKLFVFSLYFRLSGPLKNSPRKFPRISERCDSRYVFHTFAIWGTKRVRIGKFNNRRGLITRGGGYLFHQPTSALPEQGSGLRGAATGLETSFESASISCFFS